LDPWDGASFVVIIAFIIISAYFIIKSFTAAATYSRLGFLVLSTVISILR